MAGRRSASLAATPPLADSVARNFSARADLSSLVLSLASLCLPGEQCFPGEAVRPSLLTLAASSFLYQPSSASCFSKSSSSLFLGCCKAARAAW